MLSDLYDFITDATLAIGDRLYPDVLPQKTAVPAATYQVVSAIRTPTMKHNDNLPAKRVQIDIWANSPEAAFAAAEEIRELFHYYQRGQITGVQGVFADSERSLGYDPEAKLHGYSRDYIIHHAE